jgi:hypothetical protein
MLSQILLYLGSLIPIAWGVAHLFATRSVVRGYGALSDDNRHIITMEWIVEGAALIYIGVLVAAVTYVGHGGPTADVVYWLSFAMLNALSVISLLTGFRVRFLPFRLCPVLFTSASVLILIGALIQP